MCFEYTAVDMQVRHCTPDTYHHKHSSFASLSFDTAEPSALNERLAHHRAPYLIVFATYVKEKLLTNCMPVTKYVYVIYVLCI